MSEVMRCLHCGQVIGDGCYCGDSETPPEEGEYEILFSGELSENEDTLFDERSLEVLCNMDNPPGEAYETSWRLAQDLLEEATPAAAILLAKNAAAAILGVGRHRDLPANIPPALRTMDVPRSPESNSHG